MTASSVASRAKTSSVRPIGWFAIAIVGLVWLELISRLRLEWSIKSAIRLWLDRSVPNRIHFLATMANGAERYAPAHENLASRPPSS